MEENEDGVLDRAAEWVGVNRPDLDGEEYDAKLAETAAHLRELDAGASREEGLASAP